MDVLVCLDHGFVMPYGVMLASLLFNIPNGELLRVHIVVDDSVTSNDKLDIESIKDMRQNTNFLFYTIGKDILGDIHFPIYNKNFTVALYYRLFSYLLIPDTVEKILYIDGDVIINDDISSLWKVDMTDIGIAGVLDVNQSPLHYNRICLKREKGYVNGGVLLMNLRYWRKFNVKDKFLKYISENPEKLIYVDQDVINYVFQDSKLLLPLRYNVATPFFYKTKYMNFFYWDYAEEIKEAINKPAIIHFVGPEKPWKKSCHHPYKNLFLRYKSETKWASTPLIRGKIITPFIKKMLNKMGIINEVSQKQKFAS